MYEEILQFTPSFYSSKPPLDEEPDEEPVWLRHGSRLIGWMIMNSTMATQNVNKRLVALAKQRLELEVANEQQPVRS